MATIDELKGRLKGGGLRLNQYRIIFPRIPGANIDSQEISILCKATSLPGTTHEHVSVPYRGMTGHFGGETTFQGWTINLLTDTNLNTRDAFEKWHSIFRNYSTSLGEEDVSKYQVDFTVQALTRSGKVAKEYTFYNGFPTNVGEIQMSGDLNDIASFDVNLVFDYFKPSSKGQGEIR